MQAGYPSQPQLPPQPKNGLGTAGFILGLVGLVLSVIPFINVIAWPLVIIGLVLSIVGIVRVNKGQANNKGLSITGAILSVLGLIGCIFWTVVIGTAVNEVQDELAREVTVTYEVTGDAPSASVTYTTFNGENTDGPNSEDLTSLPWKKEFKSSGLIKGGTLMVSTGAEGGSVTCTVTVEGKEPKTATASGPFQMADCTPDF